ncbi:hypothetical protein PHLCEN_2v1633 [Hermanssonia centrifuga]|uniref:Photolyase/cryptochrome alpha/beta domain-containing protein n=1 Tax=Hermanssonia centrifuga TaxID=98765 RepID=A0A2R6RZM1_9APHY|nr:hypothetical protein PHLCEN_2v1633 [Hermanssonia centrifuga]
MTKRARTLSRSSQSTGTPVKPEVTVASATASNASGHALKRTRTDVEFLPKKIATVECAAKADSSPPFVKLMEYMQSTVIASAKGDAVVYWMRMEDMRINDNRAFTQASAQARKDNIPLVVLFVLSPQDYVAHDRSARRIDFMLRNLGVLKESLAKLHIPLHTILHLTRKTLPSRVLSTLSEWHATYLYANVEHELDELRRDIQVCELAKRDDKIKCTFLHDKCIIAPGIVKTKEGRGYTMLRQFLYVKAQSSRLGTVDPLACGVSMPPKGSAGSASRVNKYKDARDRVDADTTSRLSPYLAAGVISARECVRATMELSENQSKKIDVSKETGVGRWVQELAWRDFYTHVLALFPRVSMGRPFQEKFASVSWETNEEHLQAWKDGRTGVPIVDAGMRQVNKMGWMHNRLRMITAMYLVKDLMIDWRLGEKKALLRSPSVGELTYGIKPRSSH